MNASAITTSVPAVSAVNEVDNRSVYVSFAVAYVVGHGAAVLGKGAEPVLNLPSWLPLVLLGAGLVVGTVQSVSAAGRAMRGASKAEQFAGKLLGASWIIGFTALFLAITALSGIHPPLQEVLWPAGSTLVVGLIYLAEGATRRNTLHYGLGAWLTIVAGAALLLSSPGFYLVLAIAGGGAYAVAAVLERRRLADRNR